MRNKDYKQLRTILFNSILTNSTVPTIRVMDFATPTNIHFVHMFLFSKVRGNGKAHKLVPTNFSDVLGPHHLVQEGKSKPCQPLLFLHKVAPRL